MRVATKVRATVLAAAVGVLTACGGGGDTSVTQATAKAWTLAELTGTGFVGKGDVQLVYGWNNKQLQDNADNVSFRSSSTTVSEVSWICTNSNNDNLQQRERTTTSSITGVVASVARVKNQVTGFNLTGYDGSPTVTPATTEGPQLNSCPSGPWILTTPAGDPVIDEDASVTVVQVSIDGTDWRDLDATLRY